jgi:hypothetical protein
MSANNTREQTFEAARHLYIGIHVKLLGLRFDAAPYESFP